MEEPNFEDIAYEAGFKEGRKAGLLEAIEVAKKEYIPNYEIYNNGVTDAICAIRALAEKGEGK